MKLKGKVALICLCPGSVDTPMLRWEMEEMGEAAVHPAFEAKHLLGRICTTEEVARAALYLASNNSAFVTRSALAIDGGLTAG